MGERRLGVWEKGGELNVREYKLRKCEKKEKGKRSEGERIRRKGKI